MPCNDYPEFHKIEQEDNLRFKDKTDKLTAMLCALMHEHETVKEKPYRNYYSILDSAQKACGVDIEDWFNKHKKQDENRVRSLLKGLNKNELDILEKLINKQ